jgi:hypothetical protein
MSKSVLRQRISKSLIENFNRKSEKSVAEAARILLQSSDVQQCLILKTNEMRALQTGYEAAIGQPLTKAEGTKYRRELKKYLKSLSKPFPATKDRHTRFFKKLVTSKKLVFGRSIFYIPITFEAIRDNINKFNKDFFNDSGKKGGYSRDKFGKTTNLDHGADGAASGLVGAVVGAFSVKQKSKADLPKNFVKVFESNFTAVMDNSLNKLTKGQKGKLQAAVMDLVIVAEQIISEGGDVRAGISMALTPILASENLARGSAEEKQVQEAFLDAFEMTFRNIDYATLKGSSTLLEKVEKFVVVDVFDKKLKGNKRAKVTTQARSTKSSTKTKDESNTKKGRKSHTVSRIARGGALAAKPSARKARKEKSDTSIHNILGILNNKLPETVRKNMREPALENQTGRFSQSVKVVDVAKTPTGLPSIGYTYDRDNYGQFEATSGSRFASPDRDPRRLIDTSIREIAANMAIGRFFTRRI